MTRTPSPRTAEIASILASGDMTHREIADRYRVTPARVSAIARAHGIAPRRAGRRPTGAATPHTPRGRALLADLVQRAASAGVEPEALLARLGAAGGRTLIQVLAPDSGV
jgi:hypothetical protein